MLNRSCYFVVLIHTGINTEAKIQIGCETKDGEEYNSYISNIGEQAGLFAPQLFHWRTAIFYVPPAKVPGNNATN